jgi:hypothetical protein
VFRVHFRLRDIRHTSKCPWADHKPIEVFFNRQLATIPNQPPENVACILRRGTPPATVLLANSWRWIPGKPRPGAVPESTVCELPRHLVETQNLLPRSSRSSLLLRASRIPCNFCQPCGYSGHCQSTIAPIRGCGPSSPWFRVQPQPHQRSKSTRDATANHFIERQSLR